MAKEYILVADDEEDILDVLRMTISMQFSGDIVCVRSSREALETLKQRGGPLCLISDHNMPGGSGLEIDRFLQEKKISQPHRLHQQQP